MQALLEEFYRQDLHASGFVDRKLSLPEGSFLLHGITLSGKTMLVKQWLLQRKKSSYLYVDCSDVRIDLEAWDAEIDTFCIDHRIQTLVLDSYRSDMTIPDVICTVIVSQSPIPTLNLPHIVLKTLDFEEFLAFERRYDESAFNDYLKLGGFPILHKVPAETRQLVVQRALKTALGDAEFAILMLAARLHTQKVSAHLLYERLREQRRISKDMLYRSFDALLQMGYLINVAKFEHPRATKKLYLCDVAIKSALSDQKHFGRFFENLVFIELYQRTQPIYYDDTIDFYLPEHDRVVLCMPFGSTESLFTRIETAEAFIVTHGVRSVRVITMSSEGELDHPFVQVAMMPFSHWALGEED